MVGPGINAQLADLLWLAARVDRALSTTSSVLALISTYASLMFVVEQQLQSISRDATYACLMSVRTGLDHLHYPDACAAAAELMACTAALPTKQLYVRACLRHGV